MPKLQALTVGTLALLVSVFAVASGRAEAPPPPSGISSELDKAATTTPAEKIAYADSADEEIAEAIRVVEKLKDSAAREGATNETLTCLNSRLTAMKQMATVAHDSAAVMREALAANEVPQSELQFRRIAIARGKTQGLLAEARTCTGEESMDSDTLSLAVSEPDAFEDPFDNFDDFSFDDVVDLPGEPGEETAIL
jgi:hypothetical protein